MPLTLVFARVIVECLPNKSSQSDSRTWARLAVRTLVVSSARAHDTNAGRDDRRLPRMQ